MGSEAIGSMPIGHWRAEPEMRRATGGFAQSSEDVGYPSGCKDVNAFRMRTERVESRGFKALVRGVHLSNASQAEKVLDCESIGTKVKEKRT